MKVSGVCEECEGPLALFTVTGVRVESQVCLESSLVYSWGMRGGGRNTGPTLGAYILEAAAPVALKPVSSSCSPLKAGEDIIQAVLTQGWLASPCISTASLADFPEIVGLERMDLSTCSQARPNK